MRRDSIRVGEADTVLIYEGNIGEAETGSAGEQPIEE